MKKAQQTILLLILFFFCSIPTNAQTLVHDLAGELTQLFTSSEEIAVNTESLQACLETCEKSSKILKLAQEGVNKLKEVSEEIKQYSKVADILDMSVKTGNCYYKTGQVLLSGSFSDIVKVKHLATLYSMFCKSTEYVIEVNNIISSNKYQMNDAERIRFINQIHESCSKNYSNISLYSSKIMEANYYRNSLDNDYKLLQQLSF